MSEPRRRDVVILTGFLLAAALFLFARFTGLVEAVARRVFK